MKKIITYLSIAALSVLSFSACQKDDLNPDSVIKVETAPATELDKWLNDNYVKPYNIDFKYRFELNESDMNYYTVPADYDEAVIMAHLVKYLCIDTYDEVASVDFTREYFPKMFFLIGEFEYRNNGTFILGTAGRWQEDPPFRCELSERHAQAGTGGSQPLLHQDDPPRVHPYPQPDQGLSYGLQAGHRFRLCG